MMLNVFCTSGTCNRGFLKLFLLLICIRWGSSFILNWLFCVQHHEFCFPQRRKSIPFMVSPLCAFRGHLELQSSYQSMNNPQCMPTQPNLTSLTAVEEQYNQYQCATATSVPYKNEKNRKNKQRGRWPTFVALQFCKVPEHFQQLLTGWLICCFVGLEHRRCCRTVVTVDHWAWKGMEKQERKYFPTNRVKRSAAFKSELEATVPKSCINEHRKGFWRPR